MKKKISFEIETDKDNEMVEAYLKYSLKAFKLENIKIEKELEGKGK